MDARPPMPGFEEKGSIFAGLNQVRGQGREILQFNARQNLIFLYDVHLRYVKVLSI